MSRIIKLLIGNDKIRFKFIDALSILDSIFPKNNNLIIFFGYTDYTFTDNSKYLFCKFIQNYSDRFEIVWMTANERLIEKMDSNKDTNGRFVQKYSIRGFILLLKARFVIISNGVGELYSKNKITIQLWHGIPIKGLNLKLAEKAGSASRKRISYWIASSDMDRKTTSLCIGFPEERILALGYPRNDILVEQKDQASSKLLSEHPILSKKIILYAPTFRDDEDVRFFPFSDFSRSRLLDLLDKYDAYLLIRGHYIDETGRSADFKEDLSSRIIMANREDFEDVQDLLPHVDILISDYSSIWVDYLLLDRPIVFVPYDLDKFQKGRNIMYDYDAITPGPKVGDGNQFLSALEEYLRDPTKDSLLRAEVKNLFHKYEDGLAYRRVFNFINDLKFQ